MNEDGEFDEVIAQNYDDEHRDAGDLDQTVRFLANLAGNGAALEFAIGTGRVALPLSQAGINVHGIELSRAMVDQLSQKPNSTAIPVTIGDMTTTWVEGDFSLVFLVFNTIFNLTSQEDQVQCFANAAAHLRPDGHFVIEASIPPLQRLPFGETILPYDASEHHRGHDEIDVATQLFSSHHEWERGEQTIHRSIPFRYAWPAEMDLMAQLSGLELVERWGDWERAPFTKHSTRHVSVWRKP